MCISLRRPDRFPAVKANAHPYDSAFWPSLSRKGTLDRYSRSNCLRSTGEHDEERVPLSIDFAALVRGKRGPQQGAVGGQHLGVAIPKVQSQGGTVFNVSVQHREGTAG